MKRRKITGENSTMECSKIIFFDSTQRRWLVEWSDKTRSWEEYATLKDFEIFKNFIENSFTYPVYIT
jgi:hypothetical protein